MRRVIMLLSMLFGAVTPAVAQVSIGIGLPNASIGYERAPLSGIRAGARLPGRVVRPKSNDLAKPLLLTLELS